MKQSDDSVIIAENVSKQFILNQPILGPRTQSFFSFSRNLVKSARGGRSFYALKDVSFTVRRGESVGIIGRNGAGKSTLLRILSGISPVSSGRVEVKGRYASLFALNAGFSMDLTGRKNIFLNSAIAGIPLEEIKEKLDEIIEFAEVGEFIDQPVKLYSSGMRARLGFSIVMHTFPDIVFIDEALSVGDVEFKKKCFERLDSMREAEHHTLVFVSHSLTQVLRLCERVIWLDKGQLILNGPAKEVVREYQKETKTLQEDDSAYE